MVAAILCVAPLVACKEGSSLLGTSVLPVPDFAPEAVTAQNHAISVRKGGVQGTTITLEVVVTEVSEPVIGIALKLSYPKAFTRFDSAPGGCMDGDLFPTSGFVRCTETSPGSGEVFVARTITSPSQATSVTGSKVIVRLRFIVFGTGSGNLVFEGKNLGGGDASALLDTSNPPQPIFMNWFSGEIQGN